MGKSRHVFHMMTHIYTRLGQWEMCLQYGEVNVHYTHALDYLAYAYLQTGEDREVGQILKSAEQLQPERGDDVTARAYFAELLSITSGAEEPRSRIKEIRAFMKTG